MASSSREAPVNQNISGLTVSGGAKVFAGMAINATNHIHMQVCATKANQGMSVLGITSSFFLISESS